MKKIASLLLATMLVGTVYSQNARVFETMMEGPAGIEVLETQATSMLEDAGYTILATRESGVADECTGAVRVISAVNMSTMDELFALNPRTAPYALVDRIALFEDETGVYFSTIQPASLLRTVFLDDAGVDALAASRRSQMRNALGATMDRGYGQDRKKGHIGKTMGVMAGGPFNEKIGVVAEAANLTVMEAADRITAGFDAPDMDWDMEIAYRLDVPERDLVIMGVTSDEMEARSFSIVGSGSDKERKEIACAGTAYAAAYPI